jgi:hypothetical protein
MELKELSRMFSFNTWSTPLLLNETAKTVAIARVFPIREIATIKKDKERKAIKYIV